MPFLFHIGDSISLKSEVSVVEIITVATTASIIGSALYNLGYFSPLDANFASLLTVQDLLLGAAIGALPLASTAYSFRALLNMAQTVNNTRVNDEAMAVIASVFSVATVIAYFVLGTDWVGLVFLTGFGSVVLWVTLVDRHRKWKYTSPVLTLLAVITLAYATGMSSFYGSIKSVAIPISEITVKDGPVVHGRIIRATSAYFFVVDGATATAIPSANVKLIQTPQSNSKWWGS